MSFEGEDEDLARHRGHAACCVCFTGDLRQCSTLLHLNSLVIHLTNC
jgi:hypothetical protein